MTNRERAKAWMLERCPAEATGTRFGTEDVETVDTDTETGNPCDCLDALTKLLDEVRETALKEAATRCGDVRIEATGPGALALGYRNGATECGKRVLFLLAQSRQAEGASVSERKVVPEDVWKAVNACIKAMKKLDAGESIVPGSPAHQALIWGVLRLIDDHLIDHSPLTGKNLEWAQHVAEHVRAGRPMRSGG